MDKPCRGACMVAGGVCGCGGACVVARGACMVVGGMHGCRGACMVARGVCVVAGGACMVAGGHAWLPGGMHGCQGACVVAGGCVPCDLSHHAFDVTCMLSPHQLRASSYAPAYILVGHVTRTPPLWTDRHL